METTTLAPARYRNFIAGAFSEPSSDRAFENRNPADTEDLIGTGPLSGPEDLRRALEAAAGAFPKWRSTPAPARGTIVARAAALLTERKSAIARLMTREEGKTLKESAGEVEKSIRILEFMAGEARRFGGRTAPSEMPQTFCYTLRVPRGVVGMITPWNFPVAIPCWKIAPAIVAGNTVVWKPATLTPGTAAEVVRLFADAGLPPGVLNLVYGTGGTIGTALLDAASIRAVSFTGSNDVGSGVYERCAKRGVPAQCEMGGKNALVVLEDADLPLAIEATAQGAFGSTGQRCTATSRAVVVESVADAFVEGIVKKAKALRVGNGLQDGIDIGPSVDRGQMETVLRYLEIGKKEGAECLCGGSRLTGGAFDRGFFVAPTVFDRVKPTMRIAREEIFGPVLSVIRVRDFDEALQVANDSSFGLSSSLYTNDAARIFRFIDEIETGIVHVNSPTVGGEAQLPFGGMKATGIGPREQGSVAIEFYTELKTVYIDTTGRRRETNIY